MKQRRHLLSMILAAFAACFLALLSSSCAATVPDPGGGSEKAKPGLAFDPLAGVCVTTERGAVCYNPLLKQWTFKAHGTARSEPLTVIRQDNGTVTLSTASGGTLVYRDGRIEWPTEPDRGK